MEKFLKNKKIRKEIKELIEPHEIFLDALVQKKEIINFGISEKKLETPINQKTSYILYSVFIFLIIILFAKVARLQLIEGKNFFFLSENNKVRINFEIPERGVIYDKNMKQLVRNLPAFDLVLDKRDLPFSFSERKKIINSVSQILGEDPAVLEKKIKESESPEILVASNISHSTIIALKAKIKEFPGFQIKENTVRSYLSNILLSHLIGYTGKINKEELKFFKNYSITDYLGKSGIEKRYEKILRGKPAKTKIEKDAWGRIRSKKLLTPAEKGKSLVLYLDFALQKKIAQELKKGLERSGAKKGTVVALDPKTGGVLSLISFPSFDNNRLSQGISPEELKQLQNNPQKPFFNRAISGVYPPGSIIKPLIAQAALEEGIITPNQKLYAPFKLCLFNKYTGKKECFYDWKFHGWTDIKRAIAESINPFFYLIGGGYVRPNFADFRLPEKFEGLGDRRIKKWLTLFNWGTKTGIDLPEEKSGLVPDAEWKKKYLPNNLWTIGDNYNLSIGQGYLKITPLQVATAFVAIANGGKLFQPQVVQKIIEDPTNFPSKTKKIEPKIIRENFLAPEKLKIIREGMRQAVTSGSAQILSDLPIKVAAKTGTAQTPKNGYYHHWVTVFAPYENPEIVLTVLVEDVRGLQSVTLPIAKEVLFWYFSK